MDAQQYLFDIRDNVQRIQALQERRVEYFEMSLSTHGPPQVRRGTHPQGSSVESAVEKLVDSLAVEIDHEIETLVREQKTAERIIRQLPNAKWRDLLSYRYLNGWSWLKVAKAMRYDKRWVHRLHQNALQASEQVWKEEDPTNVGNETVR